MRVRPPVLVLVLRVCSLTESRSRRVMDSDALDEGRTVDYPVSGIDIDAADDSAGRSGHEVSFHVQHNIELGHGPRFDVSCRAGHAHGRPGVVELLATDVQRRNPWRGGR